MKRLSDGSMVVVAVLVVAIVYIFASDRLNYNNCMERVKLDYISKRGAEHIAAQCRAFVLDKIMVK